VVALRATGPDPFAQLLKCLAVERHADLPRPVLAAIPPIEDAPSHLPHDRTLNDR
jgi:hypothetical protein